MQTQTLDDLKRAHRFAAWSNRNTLGENLFIWKFKLGGRELPGWQMVRSRSLPAEQEISSTQSIWRIEQRHDSETLIDLSVFECASQAAAHELLVRSLGEFESPEVGRLEEGGLGDVAFGLPDGNVVLFARANLVVAIRNAGGELTAVATEVAPGFDRLLYERPEADEKKAPPEIARFQRGERRQADLEVLEIEATDPLARPLWFKFFSGKGEVLLVGGEPVYRPPAEGPREITLFAINSDRAAASRTLRLSE